GPVAPPQPDPPITDPDPPVTDPNPPQPDPKPPVIIPPVEPPDDPDEQTDDPPEGPVDEEPQGPTVTLSAINYWAELYHAEVIYVITPNDAEDITSSAVVTSAREPGYSFFIPSSSETTVRYNADVVEYMEYFSADYWHCDITVSYTLDGEAKSETFNLGASPAVADMPWLYDTGTSSSGPTNAKTVTSNLSLYYPSDYRHTFDAAGFWMVRLGWMDSSYNVILEDQQKVIWSGFDDSGPFSGPTGPVSDSGRLRLDYVYSGTVDVTPPDLTGTAAYFYLEYFYGGDAADTYDGATYDVRSPESVRSFPQPVAASTSYTDPTVTLSGITYWGEFNGPFGLHHMEVDYNIDPQDADPGSITSDVTVQAYNVDGPDTYPVDGMAVSKSGITGYGDVMANMNTYNKLFYNSGTKWQTTVTLHYTIGGAARTKEVTFPLQGPDRHYRLEMYTTGDQEMMDIDIMYPMDDPHTYELKITRVDITFYQKHTEDSGVWWENLGDSVPIWQYDPAHPERDPFVGPTTNTYDSDSDGNDDMAVINYVTGPGSLVNNALSGMSIPAGATHYFLTFHAEGRGTDTRDSAVYDIIGGLTNWLDFDSNYFEL
ncbi:MAG: hypothetical protein J5822_09280, partial [Eubacteriaceae bacterium]|nr:hypothetical protein [Eubacteriaceae bacterium]